MYMGLFIVDVDHSRERASGRWGEEGEGPGEGVWVRLARVEGGFGSVKERYYYLT